MAGNKVGERQTMHLVKPKGAKSSLWSHLTAMTDYIGWKNGEELRKFKRRGRLWRISRGIWREGRKPKRGSGKKESRTWAKNLPTKRTDLQLVETTRLLVHKIWKE